MKENNKGGFVYVGAFTIILIVVILISSISNNLLITKSSMKSKDSLVKGVNDRNGFERLYGEIINNPMIDGKISYEDLNRDYEIKEISLEKEVRQVKAFSEFRIDNILDGPVEIAYIGPDQLVDIYLPLKVNGNNETIDGFKYEGDMKILKKEDYGISKDKRLLIEGSPSSLDSYNFVISYEDLKTRVIKVIEKDGGKEIEHYIQVNVMLVNDRTVVEVFKISK